MKRFFVGAIMSGILGMGLTAVCVQGQMGASLPANYSAGMKKLFGEHKAFTSKMEMQVLDKSAKETMAVTMNYSMLDGKVRTDVDLANMKSAQMPPGTTDSLKQWGMDKMCSIMRPDKKLMYIVYPGLKAYVEMELPKEEQEAQNKEFKIEKIAQGNETVDSYACTKNKVTITDDANHKLEGTVWTAKDLKEFPVKMHFGHQENSFILVFKSVKLDKPAESEFDPPAGYDKHANVQSLMTTAMQKMAPK